MVHGFSSEPCCCPVDVVIDDGAVVVVVRVGASWPSTVTVMGSSAPLSAWSQVSGTVTVPSSPTVAVTG